MTNELADSVANHGGCTRQVFTQSTLTHMNYSRIINILLFPTLTLFSVSCFTNKQAADPYANNNPYYGPQGAYGDNTNVQPAPAPDSGGGYVAPAPAEPNYSAPPAAPPRSSGGGGSKTHTVSSGDTLYGLSRRYGTSVNAIKNANGLTSDLIRLGQKLRIP